MLSVSDNTPLSGETFTYTLQYSCASTTDDCIGMFITDQLPPEVEFVSLNGSLHTTSEVYDAATRTVTFTFDDPLAAGIVGQVEIEVRFPNGSTGNNVTASNSATIDATNATAVTDGPVNATAIATDKPITSKFLDGGGVPGELTVYAIQFCNTGNGVIENGTLSATNVTIVDTLPAGVEFVSAGYSGTYDATFNTVTFNYDTIAPGVCRWSNIVVRYPTPAFSVGDFVTNKAFISYFPLGAGESTINHSYNHTLTSPFIEIGAAKTNSQGSLYPGQEGVYTMNWWNNSNVELAGFYFEDIIPAGIEVKEIGIGAHYVNTLSGAADLSIRYQTNLNSTWTTTAGSPYHRNDGEFGLAEDVSTFGLAANEYISAVRWQFGPDPMHIASGSWADMTLLYEVMPSASVGTVTNCLIAGYDSGLINMTGSNCVDLNILSTNAGARLNPVKSRVPSTALSPGETVTFQIAIRNEWGGGDSLGNPIAYDLLPEGVTYEGTWYLPSWGNTGGYPLPTFTHITDFDGTGREFLKWEWSGASAIEIPPGDRVVVAFDARIPDIVSAGSPSFYNTTWIQGDTSP